MKTDFLHNLLKKQYSRGQSVSMISEDKSGEIKYTWADVKNKVDSISMFFMERDLQVQDRIGIFSNNSPKWHFIDFACLQNRLCSVPIYPTTTEDHLEHIINDSQLKILFVESDEQLNKANAVKDNCPSLIEIICLSDPSTDKMMSAVEDGLVVDSKKIEETELSINKEDLVTLIYTSGTTGMPKGVMIDNENFQAAIAANKDRIQVGETDRSLCFLPLSHVFERAWSYFIMTSGAENYYISNPQQVAKLIKKAQPTLMSSVPRFFEKIYTKVQGDLDKSSSSKRKIFKWATRIGRKVFSRKMNNEIVGPILYLQYVIAKKLVYSKFKDSFGGKVRFFNCGGASLQDDVNFFFQSLSLPIIYGYGLTETLATVSCYTKIPAVGSIGKPIKGLEVKIDESNNNEILVRGKSITKGYYQLPEENAKAFTEDGWFRTGDAGRLDSEGNLYYVERIKELMKTSNGKYIAPQNVEGTIMKDKFIDQIAIVAEGETFVSALIVPDYHMLEEYAKEKAIAFKDKKELLENTDIKAMLEKRVKSVQDNLHGFEKVKKFKLLEKPFSILENEITPTLKLKRKVIEKKYKHLIDEIYNKKKK